MIKKLAYLAVILAIGVAASLWVLSAPSQELIFADLPSEGDTEAGKLIFHAAGCASCHAAPEAEGDQKLILAGGQTFETPFGTFIAPNISPDEQAGIGAWSLEDFAIALTNGVSPQGQHYYPAFPYAAYRRMEAKDVADLWAYFQTLPPANEANQPHQLGFPFNIRRGLGLWKRLYLTEAPIIEMADNPRGQYLVEALAHCGECHTPRSPMGGLDTALWLAGAPNLEGEGRIPNITPGSDSIGSWSEGDIVEYLTSGFTPEYDTAGGTMADVVRNLAELPESDRQAIAAYLKAIPAH